MSEAFIETMALTFRLAGVTTLILLVIGVPIAYGLAHTRSRCKPLLEVIITMPLVLPPTVIGFYLLLLLSPDAWLGGWLQEHFDVRLVFTFPGLVLGSIVYSLPFMVQPIQVGFENLSPHLAEASFSLGKSRLETLWRVQLPNVKAALLSGLVMSFAHTIGEFGVVLMLGGNIAGQTRVASIAIYDEVESLQYAQANRYAFVLVIFTFLILWIVYAGKRRDRQNQQR